MSLEKNLRYAKLFDLYSGLLSKNQLEIYSDFLNNDLTLSEVAENRKITRQAVKDVVSKVEQKLDEFESKLGFSKKLDDLLGQIKSLKKED